LLQYLPRGHKKRRKRAGRSVHSDRIRWRVSIHDRPVDVESRTTFGHWESDSIVGRGHSGGIHASVERQFRFVCGAKIPAITAEATWFAQYRMFSLLPAHAVASVTADNGRSSRFTTNLLTSSGFPPIFETRIRPSSGERTNTSTAASDATCPRAPAFMMSPRKNVMSM
jgi:IS30 family transposase